jgi:hypothetical protein
VTASTIHIMPDDSFDDWMVRDDMGHDLGHYPTREVAETVAKRLAQERGGELVIHLPDGTTSHRSFA